MLSKGHVLGSPGLWGGYSSAQLRAPATEQHQGLRVKAEGEPKADWISSSTQLAERPGATAMGTGPRCLGVTPVPFLQILVQIVDASSVITWDFDVCKGDIVFNIYHSKRSPQPPKKDSLGAHSITSPGGNNVQLIDRAWQLGRDYSMVESPLICREGESVQVRRRRRPPCSRPTGDAVCLWHRGVSA